MRAEQLIPLPSRPPINRGEMIFTPQSPEVGDTPRPAEPWDYTIAAYQLLFQQSCIVVSVVIITACVFGSVVKELSLIKQDFSVI